MKSTFSFISKISFYSVHLCGIFLRLPTVTHLGSELTVSLEFSPFLFSPEILLKKKFFFETDVYFFQTINFLLGIAN